ncbi:diacylglycerol/lipid kinase family protein [Oceanobacillus neutriphilus]|uniref:Lipid kinase YtlR n=1 Tax=Oceanobacillus neutriphilus TaxID=531815 RepID=A0ABQ2NZC8_9BACI|nr:YegS/Rv2252/BmrU family lipid kinase [Oceanobacillus neutriphilus]GGP14279.1 putative lipid kinase YtlR [Oceanobacillus neutriphilus]
MYLLIVNPNAGNGHAKKVFERIQKMASYQNIERKTLFTNQPGDGQSIAETYSKNELIKHVIVIGGDGTMHEVMNGWSNQAVPISFIPGGSGNDFAKGTGQRNNAEKQWQNIISNPAKHPFWNGSFQPENGREKKFINSIGIGIDAATTEISNQSRLKGWLNHLRLGKLIYLIALIQAILRFQPMNIRLMYNGMTKHIENVWMVSAANHPYCGGGLKVVPHATVNPNDLSVLVIHQISKKKILLLFLLVIFGLHRYLKEVELFQVKEMTIEVESPVSYQADGETGRLQTCYIKRDKQAVYINK